MHVIYVILLCNLMYAQRGFSFNSHKYQLKSDISDQFWTIDLSG